jgi:hypothetical protein
VVSEGAKQMEEFAQIALHYEGLDTDNNQIDLAQLGQSIQGAAKLLGMAGTLVITGNYDKRLDLLPTRVLAGVPRSGSYDLLTILAATGPFIAPFTPIITEVATAKLTEAVEAVVNFSIAKWTGKKQETDRNYEIARAAMEEVGHTSRMALAAMERVALASRPPLRDFAAPIGSSCHVAAIGEPRRGSIPLDQSLRRVIEGTYPVAIGAEIPTERLVAAKAQPEEIGEEEEYTILLSELDLKSKTCKFSFRKDDNRRVIGKITDPSLAPYVDSMLSQRWITVLGRPLIKGGKINRLFISRVRKDLQ